MGKPRCTREGTCPGSPGWAQLGRLAPVSHPAILHVAHAPPSLAPLVHLGLPRLGLCVSGTPYPFFNYRGPAWQWCHRGQQPSGGLTEASVWPEGLPVSHGAAASCGACGRPPAAHQPDEDGRGLWLQAGVRGAGPQASQAPHQGLAWFLPVHPALADPQPPPKGLLLGQSPT